jgi:SAM-dependent methyltransferase
MIGSELANHTGYLLNRASSELAVRPTVGTISQRLAPVFVKTFGVPETGAQMRILHAMSNVPAGALRIVDVGCGAGMLLGGLHRNLPTRELVGIEIDHESSRVAAAAHPYAIVVNDDAIVVADKMANRFDCAITIDVLEHVHDKALPDFARSLFTLLRPGGTLIVHVPAINQRRHFKTFEDWGHHDHAREGFSAASLSELLRANGFRVDRIAGTFGYLASLAWELNMLSAAKPIQAVAFPLLMGLTVLGERLPSARYNGLLCVATRL